LKISPSGKLTTFAGKVGKSGRPKPGKATSTKLQCPEALVTDADRNVYLIDSDAVLKVTPRGRLSVVAGTVGESGYPSPGPATESLLGNPRDLAIDKAGNIFIADAGPYSLVEKVSANGELSIIAGRGGMGRPKFGRAATAAYLGIPSSVAVGKGGIVYIGISNGLSTATGTYAVVAAVTPDGKLERVAGRMTKVGKPRPGPASKSRLDGPLWMTMGPKNTLYAGFGVALGSKGSYIVKITSSNRLSVVQKNFTVR
ncbi:MAG: hypothetical protein M3Y20_03090, partial [Actinomycetota bacterium]|nr:hypothetical protein [Actinomycetota bacterium]